MSGDVLSLGAVAALAIAGAVAGRRAGSRAGRWLYHQTYEVIDSEGETVERGFVVNGCDIEISEGVVGEQARRWFAENQADMEIELADDEEVYEALLIDTDVVSVPEWVRAAIIFASDHGRVIDRDTSAHGSWLTNWNHSMRTGDERQEGYFLADAEYKTLGGVKRVAWPKEAPSLIDLLIEQRECGFERSAKKRLAHREKLNKLLAQITQRPVAQIAEMRQ